MAEVRTVSYTQDTLEYVQKLAERLDINESAAVRECILCHKAVTKIYPDWRNINTTPAWTGSLVDRIVEKLKTLSIVTDGKEQEVREQIEHSLDEDWELFK